MSNTNIFMHHLGLELAVIRLESSFCTCFHQLLKLCVDSWKACMHDSLLHHQKVWQDKERQTRASNLHCHPVSQAALHSLSRLSGLYWCDSKLGKKIKIAGWSTPWGSADSALQYPLQSLADKLTSQQWSRSGTSKLQASCLQQLHKSVYELLHIWHTSVLGLVHTVRDPNMLAERSGTDVSHHCR